MEGFGPGPGPAVIGPTRLRRTRTATTTSTTARATAPISHGTAERRRVVGAPGAYAVGPGPTGGTGDDGTGGGVRGSAVVAADQTRPSQ